MIVLVVSGEVSGGVMSIVLLLVVSLCLLGLVLGGVLGLVVIWFFVFCFWWCSWCCNCLRGFSGRCGFCFFVNSGYQAPSEGWLELLLLFCSVGNCNFYR